MGKFDALAGLTARTESMGDTLHFDREAKHAKRVKAKTALKGIIPALEQSIFGNKRAEAQLAKVKKLLKDL